MPPRAAAWNGAGVKTKLSLAQLTRGSLLGALICATPLPVFARGERGMSERGERSAPEFSAREMQSLPQFPQRQPQSARQYSPRKTTARLQTRSQLPDGRRTVSKEYIRQRLDWFRVKDPRHFRTHAYFDTLIEAGYDPVLLDGWLDGLYDGVVVVGMPGDLVLDYYGEPTFRNEVVYAGAPAVEWGIQLLPGRVERVTVAGGKIVRVRG